MGDQEQSLQGQIEDELGQLSEDDVMAEVRKVIAQRIKNRNRPRTALSKEQRQAYYLKRKDDPKYKAARSAYLKRRAERNKKLLAMAKESFTPEQLAELGL